MGRKASGDLSFFSPLSLLGSGGETDDDEPVLEIVVVEVRQGITHTLTLLLANFVEDVVR